MTKLMMAAGAAALLSACAMMPAGMGGMGAPMDPRMGAPMGGMAMPTRAAAYSQMAHSSDLFEIQSSQTALQVSRNPGVTAFAQQMVADHTRMMNEMMAMPGMNMSMHSMGMAPRHARMLQMLRSAPSAQFDAMYVRDQVMAHQEALAMHQTYAARGDNPALRAMAARAVPMIQMHLQRAQQLQAGMGAMSM
ncbi:MAG: DUF4142 domain-containing protein [Pseudomonadota bacterium]|nr:DUF4142 domain-containing protein [Pseudomonadota bacterium]